jgi:hypothetical protein
MAETYEVQQGDTIVSIADQQGFRNWRTIWDREENAELRNLRKNPQVLFPGDQVFIPDKVPKEHSCATNQRHTFMIPVPLARVRVLLEDAEGRPYADKEYRLTVNGQDFNGRTASNGLVEHEVPADAHAATLTLWTDDERREALTWSLQIGYLDPEEEISGVQARLNNLGYSCGEVNGELNEATIAALKAFQWDHQLAMSGEIDDPTRAKLDSLYEK